MPMAWINTHTQILKSLYNSSVLSKIHLDITPSSDKGKHNFSFITRTDHLTDNIAEAHANTGLLWYQQHH